MPCFISSHVSSFLSSLQIVDDDQVVLTSSADCTVRLWSARGHFIGESHFASVSLLHCHANKINLEVENASIYGHVHFSNDSTCEWINTRGVWGKNELLGPCVPMAPPALNALCSCLVTCKYPSSTVHKANSMSSSATPYHNEPKKQPLLLCCNNMGSQVYHLHFINMHHVMQDQDSHQDNLEASSTKSNHKN